MQWTGLMGESEFKVAGASQSAGVPYWGGDCCRSVGEGADFARKWRSWGPGLEDVI